MFSRNLYQKLYRFDCPSTEALRDYYWGALPSEQMREVKAHLALCPHCLAELNGLTEFLAQERLDSQQELVESQSLLDKVQVIVARLAMPKSERVALPALRGASREVLLFDTDDVGLTIQVEEAFRERLRITGQILLTHPQDLANSEARLNSLTVQDQRRVAPIDQNGNFVLVDVQPGQYQLIVQMPVRRIIVPSVIFE